MRNILYQSIYRRSRDGSPHHADSQIKRDTTWRLVRRWSVCHILDAPRRTLGGICRQCLRSNINSKCGRLDQSPFTKLADAQGHSCRYCLKGLVSSHWHDDRNKVLDSVPSKFSDWLMLDFPTIIAVFPAGPRICLLHGARPTSARACGVWTIRDGKRAVRWLQESWVKKRKVDGVSCFAGYPWLTPTAGLTGKNAVKIYRFGPRGLRTCGFFSSGTWLERLACRP